MQQFGFIDIINKYAEQMGIDRTVCYIMVFLVILVSAYGIVKAICGGRDRRRGEEVLPRHGYDRHLEVPQAPPTPARHHHTETHRTEMRYEERTVTSRKRTCKSCGALNKEDALFCTDCGSMM